MLKRQNQIVTIRRERNTTWGCSQQHCVSEASAARSLNARVEGNYTVLFLKRYKQKVERIACYSRLALPLWTPTDLKKTKKTPKPCMWCAEAMWLMSTWDFLGNIDFHIVQGAQSQNKCDDYHAPRCTDKVFGGLRNTKKEARRGERCEWIVAANQSPEREQKQSTINQKWTSDFFFVVVVKHFGRQIFMLEKCNIKKNMIDWNIATKWKLL